MKAYQKQNRKKMLTTSEEYYSRPSLGTSYTIAVICMVCLVVLVAGLAFAQLFV